LSRAIGTWSSHPPHNSKTRRLEAS
jgi:hypothetical protein